jgi:hypothetical protein
LIVPVETWLTAPVAFEITSTFIAVSSSYHACKIAPRSPRAIKNGKLPR